MVLKHLLFYGLSIIINNIISLNEEEVRIIVIKTFQEYDIYPLLRSLPDEKETNRKMGKN